MGNFNRDNRHNGYKSGNRDSGPVTMHKAICGTCGKECEIPFKPTGTRPVLCSDCFRTSKRFDSGSSDRGNFRRSGREDRSMYDAICSTCGNNCKIPFQPRPGKPVFCSNCFEKKEGFDSRKPQTEYPKKDQYKEQFESLNAKLDKILKLLTPVISEEKIQKESTYKKPKKAKTTTKKKTSPKKKKN